MAAIMKTNSLTETTEFLEKTGVVSGQVPAHVIDRLKTRISELPPKKKYLKKLIMLAE